jgi:hypothetical protein
LEFFQQPNQMMNAAVGLLRAGFQQIVKLSIASDKFLNREHPFASVLAESVDVGNARACGARQPESIWA